MSSSFETLVHDHYINPSYNEFSMIIINFSVGVILGPTSLGLVTYLFFVLIYECLYMFLNKGKGYSANPFYRCAYICAGISGWIIGRYIANRNNGDPLAGGNLAIDEANRQSSS